MEGPAAAALPSAESHHRHNAPAHPALSPSEFPATTSQSLAAYGRERVIKPDSFQQRLPGAKVITNVAGRVTSVPRSTNTPSSAELRKLKRRVDPMKRKRVALACDSCKRRKQKCDGDHPCSICQKKNFVCTYTPTNVGSLVCRRGDDDEKQSATPGPAFGEPKGNNPTSRRHSATASCASNRHSEAQSISSAKELWKEESPFSSPSSPVLPDTGMPSPPEIQRHQQQQRHHRKWSHSRNEYEVQTVGDGQNALLLCDEKGHLRYMGESSVLSFLEQSRKAFRKVMGDTIFTLNPAQVRLIDGSTHRSSISPLQLPSPSLTIELIEAFEENVQAFDYVFDMDHFRCQVAQIYRNPMGAPRQWLCLLHFTCALGAIFVHSKQQLDTERLNIPPFSGMNNSQPNGTNIQSKREEDSSGSPIDPALFFESGLGLMNDTAEDGEIWVVQAYLLMSMYYQIICKRNASWIRLGLAIRFAQALGMHRKCVNMTFLKPDRILRQRIWRTLYIQDRFWSSTLGRPLAIDDCDWDDRDTSELILVDRTAVELLKLCEIIGNICLLVYRQQSVSSSTSQKFVTRLREWSDRLPPDIHLSSLQLHTPDGSNIGIGSIANDESRRQMIRNQVLLRLHLTHLNGIILATRPFLLLMVAMSQSQTPLQTSSQAKTVLRLSSSCVLCAARSVDLIMTSFAHHQQPVRSHLMTYFIFTAGIVLLLESFRQRRSEVESHIARDIFFCMFILGHYGNFDPSAKHYQSILQEMDRAAKASRTHKVDSQKKPNSQANTLLSSNGPAMPAVPTTDEMPCGPYVMPTPGNSSVGSELGSWKSVDKSANPDYDEKYLRDILGYGCNNLMASDNITNLSRLFLNAAVNDGQYQVSDSPVDCVLTPDRPKPDDDTVIAVTASVPSLLPFPATDTAASTPSSKGGTPNVSTTNAMSQYLIGDTLGVSGGSSDEPNISFSFDLDMMDWTKVALSSDGG
ncbi:fungal-specific transcription factor domain-containing protein [Lipomyces chichibuensis]|uniref:fungal-specific transcription factor domain-containing protein n=1 Tax=Lipomyces chichibuensis TaxID=1546026 RepID=UPI003343E810